ncbi:hypothetical protein [Sinorhizobium sp. BG8]|uniref:hypothetical protein n=1 Tax=Sinorhizobium sp. BG8 TaxID=2613773 RepID=UPI00193EA3E6|nr:hypothetical protein [Sinorhizobium sp. BG8]QRM55566.1 hypothetical protein F3Y30_14305 [Sinorhizobium sp. BG8]
MRKRFAVLAGALSIACLAFVANSRADTISYADAVSLLAKECGADIRKFCRGLNLGGGRIQSCLNDHAGKVSPTCTTTLANVTASIQQRQAAQLAYKSICEHDMAQFCHGVKGDGNILSCLLKARRVENSKCGQAITDAGWR